MIKTSEIFKSATVKLTAWYTLIIMLVSIFFSIVLYGGATHEFDRAARREALFFDRAPMPFSVNVDEFNDFRVQQLRDAKRNIARNLVGFNVVILLLGGGASYLLARKTLKPIEEALEAQNRFTADASHELRTPLTSMKTEIEVALRDKNFNTEEAKKVLKSSLEEVGRLEKLSSGLLTLASNGDKLHEHSFQKVSLKKIVEEAQFKMEKRAKEKQIVLESKGDNVYVLGDEWSLMEAVCILLDNAIKFSNEKSRITITSNQAGQHATLQVQDFGVGIDKMHLPHIFERFYRADASREKNSDGGYGLGLSIAKKIVDAHHGAISVQSELGSGTIFTVKIPSYPKS